MREIRLENILEKIKDQYGLEFLDCLLGVSGLRVLLFGGAVRDTILGKEWKDLDIRIVLGNDWDERERTLEKALNGCGDIKEKIRFQNDDFTVYKFLPNGAKNNQNIDISLTPSLGVAKSDFTINSIFFDLKTGELIDGDGGLSDLEDRIVKTVEDPFRRFRIYPSEMLRAIKMACQFDMEIDEGTKKAIGETKDFLKRDLSYVGNNKYDLWSESILGALFGGLQHNPNKYLQLMEEMGILETLVQFLSEKAGIINPGVVKLEVFFADSDDLEQRISSFLGGIVCLFSGNKDSEDIFIEIKSALALDVPRRHGELPVDIEKIKYTA